MFFSILVRDRSTNKIVRSIESILRVLIEVQKADPNFKLNDVQKSEIGLFQTLLKIAKQDKKAGWYDIPITKFAPVFPLLAEQEEVLDEKTKERIMFTDNMWSLNMDVSTTNVNGATNIVLELFWTRPDKDETYPFEEINYFSRQIKWGRYKNVIFPILYVYMADTDFFRFNSCLKKNVSRFNTICCPWVDMNIDCCTGFLMCNSCGTQHPSFFVIKYFADTYLTNVTCAYSVNSIFKFTYQYF